MTNRNTLYRLLFDAILELRESGHQAGDPKVSGLADLFHQFPSWLQDLDANTVTADDVLTRLKERAEDLRIGRWVEARLAVQAEQTPVPPADEVASAMPGL